MTHAYNSENSTHRSTGDGAPAQDSAVDLRDELESLWVWHAAINAAIDEGTGLDSGARLLLAVLSRHEPIRSTDLAPLLRLSRAGVSRRITALTGQDLVEAAADPHDGRASLLQLTQRGHDYRRQGLDSATELITGLTSGFTAKEIDTFARLLSKFNANVKQLPAIDTHDGKR